ncbi:MAG: M48 family metallopeptidase [Acidimicrobiia bacterium]|nr:M48 family metallopeptidase [Acidimicrobiia bacterium]
MRAADRSNDADPEPDTMQPSPTPGSGPNLEPLTAQVTRSKRRRKTAEGRLRGNVVDIRIPAASTATDERHFVEHFLARFERSRRAELVDLAERAGHLAREYGLPAPTSIRWVSNQRQRWGSCTPADGSVRLSDRMVSFPPWVVDYVIVHELAHLVEMGHTALFWELVDAYPRAERAKGYLQAKAEDSS